MNEQIKPTNALTMRFSGDVDGLVAFLCDQDADPNNRLIAANNLWRFPSDVVVRVLIDRLGDLDIDVRKASVRSLGKLGDQSAVEPLLRLANEERSGHLYDWALDSLARLGATEVVPLLLYELKTRERRMRRWAAKTLSRVGGAECIEPLRAAARRDLPRTVLYRRAVKLVESRARSS